MLRRTLTLALVCLLGCGGADHETMLDASSGLERDAPVDLDGGRDDTGEPPGSDAGSEVDARPETDAARADDAAADPILAISGACGVLDDELADELPYWVQNASTFAEGFSRVDAARLGEGAQTILADGTAGGSSGYSEAFAFEVLERCEGASLVASETMIRYATPAPGAIADILVEIDGVRVGVSVTRAVTVTGMCMRADTYTLAAATELLTRKVGDLHEASTLVSAEHAWTKNLVFVYADTTAHAMTMMTAWAGLDAALRADTIVYVSVSEEMDAFIYFEDRCG
jgi:hypothetical protein